MVQTEKDIISTETVKAGKRIYYFDVKQSKNGDRYVAITESKKIVSGTDDNMQVNYEKHKLFLYKEDFEKFTAALSHAINTASEGNDTENSTIGNQDVTDTDGNIDIEF